MRKPKTNHNARKALKQIMVSKNAHKIVKNEAQRRGWKLWTTAEELIQRGAQVEV